jgi:membrane protein insertase Oxa1/YidC/SpoIIIJ
MDKPAHFWDKRIMFGPGRLFSSGFSNFQHVCWCCNSRINLVYTKILQSIILKFWIIIVPTMTKAITEERRMYTLAGKLDILKEAYNDNGTTAVKSTAKKYLYSHNPVSCS